MLFGGGNSGVVGADIRTRKKQEFIFKSIFITTERPLGAGGTTPTQMPSIQVKRRARRTQRSRRRQPSYVDLRIVCRFYIFSKKRKGLKKKVGFFSEMSVFRRWEGGKGGMEGGKRGSWGGREA